MTVQMAEEDLIRYPDPDSYSVASSTVTVRTADSENNRSMVHSKSIRSTVHRRDSQYSFSTLTALYLIFKTQCFYLVSQTPSSTALRAVLMTLTDHLFFTFFCHLSCDSGLMTHKERTGVCSRLIPLTAECDMIAVYVTFRMHQVNHVEPENP